AQPFRARGIARYALDIVGRIAVRRLGDPIEHPLDLVEAKQERTRKRRNPGHCLKALCQATLRGPCGAPRSGATKRRPMSVYGVPGTWSQGAEKCSPGLGISGLRSFC